MKQISIFLILSLCQFTSLFAGGFIIVKPENSRWEPCVRCPIPPRPLPPPPPNFTPFPLEVKSEKVTVDIEEQVATTYIDQVFYNPTRRIVEGYFMFPIPKSAVIKQFSMYINGKETQGELLDANKARKIYEDIVRQFRDPALLEYSQQDLFKARIFPIQARSEQRIKISYTHLLPKEDETIAFTYPLNTKKLAAQTIENISIDIKICSHTKITNVYCPTHEAEIIRKGQQDVKVGFETSKVKPNTDFQLYFTLDNAQVSHSLLSYQKRNEDGYFFLSLSPSTVEQRTEIAEKDITFVLDVSGSMSGEKLDKAKEALRFCVNTLNANDRFNIIRFSTEARSLFADLEKVSKKSRQEAREFIQELKAIGGTNIGEALMEALQVEPRKNRPYMIVFITDGKPTVGITEEASLLKKVTQYNGRNTRIFTFGIGEEINTHLLDKITEATQAYRSYILPNEDIEVKISNFYTKVSTPILTDLQLNFSKNIKKYSVYPKNLPDLFQGSSITVLGRYSGKGKASISLTGLLNGKSKKYDFLANFAQNNQQHEFIPPLWAARAVGYLLDQIRLHGESKELVDEVTALAKKYGIVTPYTSYLILEDEEITISRQDRQTRPTPRLFWGRTNANKSMITEEYEVPAQDYYSMQRKSGASSVRSSREIQGLNQAENIAQTRQGQKRMNYMEADGTTKDVAQQYRNIHGRAIYQSIDNQWIDSSIAKNKDAKTIRIAFASDDYFDLLKNEPATAKFLSLSNNVQFYWKGNIYEIYE